MFPYGYAGSFVSFQDLSRKRTWYLLDSEFRRRVWAMMQAAAAEGVPLGVGTGWRVQPNPPPPGFAAPGNSHHESMPANTSTATAVAADMVPKSSWEWMDRNVTRFGLRTFTKVNNEPWHIQPVEIPASRNRRTTPYQLMRWNLPTEPQPEPAPPPPTPPVPPATPPEVIVLNVTREVIDHTRGRQTGFHVKIAQSLVNGMSRRRENYIPVDGDYGLVSIGAVMDFQRAYGLNPDGIIGPITWDKLENG